ncbi:hypothetical protein GUA87_10550 [Sneathiella sp. P13V-1]|uniref:AAA family ATPase n=1 Tax=Sneathiella sp. P13V-1 TaxID=2697366 RepID=UPI00187BC11F|nr:hypothetical protein [Sneathiella sp. P13V-1]MBE7637285.1 hypothetical protein [Sneathiella sp. P13V-1]
MNSPYPMLSQRSKNTLIAFLNSEEEIERLSQISVNQGIQLLKAQVGTIRNSIEFFKNNPSSNILIVDITGEDFPLDRIDELAEVCAPAVKVVVVGDRDSVGLYRALLDRGVSDYLVRPLPESLLVDILKQLVVGDVQKRRPSSNGKTIGVMGAVGGVGTSHLVANMGYILSSINNSQTTIADLGGGSHFSLIYGQKPVGGLEELLQNPDRIDDLLLERSLQFLGRRLDLLGVNSETMLPHIDREAFTKLIRLISHRRHYLLLDFPSYHSANHFENFCNCDAKFILVPPSLRGCLTARNILKNARALNPEGGIQVVLSNARPTSKDTLRLNEVEDILEKKIAAFIPFDGKLFTKSELEGQPVFSLNSRGRTLYSQILPLISSHKQTKEKATSKWGGLNVWKKK